MDISTGSDSVETSTTVGRIRGRVVSSPAGRTVDEYLGIPFAAPPVGELRYSDPRPLDVLPQGQHTFVVSCCRLRTWIIDNWIICQRPVSWSPCALLTYIFLLVQAKNAFVSQKVQPYIGGHMKPAPDPIASCMYNYTVSVAHVVTVETHT